VRRSQLAPIVFFNSFDDNIRANCNRIWEDRKAKFAGRIHFIPRINELRLVKDGVHLTDASAKRFFEHIVESSLLYFNGTEAQGGQRSAMDLTESNRSESEMDTESIADRTLTQSFRGTRKRPAVDPMVRRTEFEAFKGEVQRRFETVLYTSARHSEDIDYTINQSNLNKIIVSGLNVEGIYDVEEKKDRVKLLRSAFDKLRKEIVADYNKVFKANIAIPEEVFVRHLNERLRGPKEDRPRRQRVEVVFSEQDIAVSLRDCYAALNKRWRADKAIPENYKGIFLTPSHSQRTRVRLEILKTLANTINKTRGKDEGAAWVVGHLSRPVLKVTFGKDSAPKTYTYADAIKWSQGRYQLADQDLLEAYRIAGNSCGDSIENHFIVLKSSSRARSFAGHQMNKRQRNN